MINKPWLRIEFEPRWPAFAIGFHKRRFYNNYTFVIVLWALVIELGDLS